MKEIRIGQTAQLVLLATLVAGIVAAIAAQLPELRRYMKVRSM